jgi:hypothetical protein
MEHDKIFLVVNACDRHMRGDVYADYRSEMVQAGQCGEDYTVNCPGIGYKGVPPFV